MNLVGVGSNSNQHLRIFTDLQFSCKKLSVSIQTQIGYCGGAPGYFVIKARLSD
jgi:hypothetical protein